jgi:hypothetical protein
VLVRKNPRRAMPIKRVNDTRNLKSWSCHPLNGHVLSYAIHRTNHEPRQYVIRA